MMEGVSRWKEATRVFGTISPDPDVRPRRDMGEG